RGELRALLRVLWGGCADALLGNLERPSRRRIELFALVCFRLLDGLREVFEIAFVRLGVQELGVGIDEGRVGESGGGKLALALGDLAIESLDEFVRGLRFRRRLRLLRTTRTDDDCQQ